MRRARARARAIGTLLVGVLVLTGCADDDAAVDADAEGTVTTDEEETAEEDTADEDAAAEAEATTVTAVDYAYPDAPSEIEAGTQIVLENESDAEVHEILAFRIPDDDDRSVEELLQQPEEGLATLEMRGVALAPPGQDSTTTPAPPLTLDEPGRYAFVCGIPTDAPPDEVMAAVEEFMAAGGEGPGGPEYPETGPPHFTQGMFAEVTVTAEAG